MDFNNGGPSSNSNNSKQHKTAAEIAREKVLAVYSSTVKSIKKLSPDAPHSSKNDQYITPPVPGAFYSRPNESSNQPPYSEPLSEPSELDPSAYPLQSTTTNSDAYNTASYEQPTYSANSYEQPTYDNYDQATYSANSYNNYGNQSDYNNSYNQNTYSNSYDQNNQNYNSQTYSQGSQDSQSYQNYDAQNYGSNYDTNYNAQNNYTTDAYSQNGTYFQNDTYPENTGAPTNNSAGYDYADETSSLKDAPINQTVVTDEWQQYHSAWQNYYQNYYSDYYAKAAQNYLATEKLKNERVASGTVRKRRNVKRLIPIFILVAVILGTLFMQYNRLIFAPIMAYVSPNTESAPTSIEAVDPNVSGSVTPDPRLIIPKLNIDVPVAFGINYNDTLEAMNHGVAQFMIPGASAMPGQIGNLVISGHSAGDIYSSNPYKFIFSGLERLEPGDLIYVNYESKRYTYQMTGSEVVEPTNVAALIYETNKPILTLITCTPLGTSRYRLLVIAEQINPTYGNEAPSEPPVTEDTNISMPANEPSFFENIWNGLFGN